MSGVTYSELQADASGFINTYGQPVVLKFYTPSGATTGYDDDKVLTQSGVSLWTSGLVQPLSSKYGSADAQMVQQGRLLFDDSRLYVPGDTYSTGYLPMKVGVGSPVPSWYVVLPPGVEGSPEVNGEFVYKKMYIRALPAGSLIGE